MKRLKRLRLIGIVAALIAVVATSIFAYAEFNSQTANVFRVGLQSSPQVPSQIQPLCPNGIDLSTGTNGGIVPVPLGTVDVWAVAPDPPATSVIPVISWIQAPFYPARINWISPTASTASTYTYTRTFTASLGGTFFLYAFSADNSVQLTLTGPGPTTATYASGSYPATGAFDFQQWWPGNWPAGLLLFNQGTYTLTATVANQAGTRTGLAVYAVFCPQWPPNFTPRFSYTVKFLCNLGTDASHAQNIGLEPGFYQTDINIHNPSFQASNATIVKKFVLAVPEEVGPPPAIQTVPAVPSPYVLRWAILQPDAAMRLDCREILGLVSPAGTLLTFGKGFVILYSDTGRLDVWAEYTAANSSGFGVVAVEIVKIPPAPFIP